MEKKNQVIQKLKNELYESDSYIENLNMKIKNETENLDKLRKEFDILLEKYNSLSNYNLESEQKFSEDVIKYQTEISELNKQLELKNIIEKKSNKILDMYEKCKTEINLMNINVINFQKEIEHKNIVINELERANIKLYENINLLSEMNLKSDENSLEGEIKIEEFENMFNENKLLKEEIEQLKKRNNYLDSEMSKLNHANFKLQTCINTIKNSKTSFSINNNKDDYCCCTCF